MGCFVGVSPVSFLCSCHHLTFVPCLTGVDPNTTTTNSSTNPPLRPFQKVTPHPPPYFYRPSSLTLETVVVSDLDNVIRSPPTTPSPPVLHNLTDLGGPTSRGMNLKDVSFSVVLPSKRKSTRSHRDKNRSTHTKWE